MKKQIEINYDYKKKYRELKKEHDDVLIEYRRLRKEFDELFARVFHEQQNKAYLRGGFNRGQR
jgi:hypothetical protein